MYRLLVATLMAGMVALSPASATSVVRFSFDSLCENSVRIAHVICVETEPVITDDGVRTRTLFRVIEGVKGDVSREIEIALPGGQIGAKHVMVAGIPTFTAGRETVIFLTGPDGSGSPWPIGLGQGCYRVVTDETEGRSVHFQRGMTPIPEGVLFKPTSAGVHRVDLRSFLDKVRETVALPSEEVK